jgi:CHASE3 domain sensor protein/putative methionine-R-sulfoxide reductase with GAF domain
MNEVLRRFYRRHGVKIALYLVIALILVDTFLTYQYKQALSSNIETQAMLDEIAARKASIISNLNNVDMSLRGYLLVGNEAFIDTYEKVKGQNAPTMVYLKQKLPEIGMDAANLSQLDAMLNSYFKLMDELVSLAKAGTTDAALKILKEDHGTAVWQTYMNMSGVVDPVINAKKTEAQQTYTNLLNMSLLFQGVLFLVGIPTLIYTISNLTRSEKRRTKLFEDLDLQNRTLIFDSNQKANVENEAEVIGKIITNLKKTAAFIKGIGQGNFDVKWDGFGAADLKTNEHTISGELIAMREEMKKQREQGLRHQWASDGLNKLTEIIRDHQSDLESLTGKSVSFIVKYLKAHQGGLFVLNDQDDDDKHLELRTCYAFDRKKHVTKRVDIGEGIIGQVFLEGEPVYIRDVPPDYIHITSGLGEANPRCITVQPLKHNDEVVAILEIASFTELDQHALDFLITACKSLAASMMALHSSHKTKILLEKSQQQAEEMRAQEEEMRQNMEELEATQEEMKRRESELRIALKK